MMRKVVAEASPSLALVKYWGKRNIRRNLPATPSLAITLKNLYTRTEVTATEGADSVVIGGKEENPNRFHPFFDYARKRFDIQCGFEVVSENNFPTAAGLASSSSGFAALSLACSGFSLKRIDIRTISEVARIGSASAARAVFGGFTLLRAGAAHAEPIKPASFWPEFRVLVVITRTDTKELSSRNAMERSRTTSPYYGAWVRDSQKVFTQAREGLERKDIAMLGEAVVLSYSRMFATMLSSNPPFLYWIPSSLAIIRAVSEFREKGIGVWETMDAGPQVKLICLDKDMTAIKDALKDAVEDIDFIESTPGAAASIIEESR